MYERGKQDYFGDLYLYPQNTAINDGYNTGDLYSREKKNFTSRILERHYLTSAIRDSLCSLEPTECGANARVVVASADYGAISFNPYGVKAIPIENASQCFTENVLDFEKPGANFRNVTR